MDSSHGTKQVYGIGFILNVACNLFKIENFTAPRAYILHFEGLNPRFQFFTHHLGSNINFLAEGFNDSFVNRVFRENVYIGHRKFLTNTINSCFGLSSFF